MEQLIKIFLLTSLMTSLYQTTATEFCKGIAMAQVQLNGQTWCIKYDKRLRTFNQANKECNKLTGGPNNSLRGHLVEIFSQEDNQFIRNFIQKNKIQSSDSEFRAFIGLYHKNNTYKWVNSTQEPTYFDADPSYSGSRLKVAESMQTDGINKGIDWQPDGPVVITETDWKIYNTNSTNFVCQVPPNTSMSVACTDKKEGSSGTLFEATLRSPDILNFRHQDLSQNGSIIVVRRNAHVIDHNITVNKDAVTVKVMCDKCSLADEGQYLINVSTVFRWNNFEETCDLTVFPRKQCPADLRATNISFETATLTWSQTNSQVESMKYNIELWSIQGQLVNNWTVNSASNSLISHQIMSLESDTSYLVSVYPTNIFGALNCTPVELKTAVLPEVVISCPIAEEGKMNHSLWCSIKTYVDLQNPSIRFCRNNSTNMCNTNGYTTSNQRVGSNITARLNISSVRRKDEGTWTCFISFTVSSGTHHMHKKCNLIIYSSTQTPVCQHTSNTTHVLVTCSTYKVYPEARCVWQATFGIERIEVLPVSIQHKKYILDESVNYNTTCTASFSPDVTGVFKIEVAMYPDVIHTKQGVAQDYMITIGPPDCPNLFDVKLINNDSVIISWIPGHNGGLTQTFVFLSHRSTSLNRTVVATVVDDNKDSMVYIVRNLYMDTSLVFSVQVQNVLSATECPDLNVMLMVSDSRKIDSGSNVSDTNFLYYIIPLCLVVFIAIVTALSVKKGCSAYKRKRQHKTESNLNATSLHLPLDEAGYLLVLSTSVGSPPIEHSNKNVQVVIGSDVEHESVGNVRVDITRNREHALEGSNSENPYNVIQETEDTMGHVVSNEQRNPSTRQDTHQTRTSENVPGPSRTSDLTNVYDRLDENLYNDYIDVYNVPD